MNTLYVWASILGLALMSLASRAFFFLPRREYALPEVARRGLRYAPLAALAAVVTPEIFFEHAHVIEGWHQPKLYAALAASGYFWWRRGLMGTIFSGTAVLLALKLGLGW